MPAPKSATLFAGAVEDGPSALHAAKVPGVRHSVVIADADPLARRVVRDALQDGTPFVVAAEASDGIEAVELICHYSPDIVLLETSLPRLDGMSVIRKVQQQTADVQFVVFSVAADVDQELEAVRAGAAGYVTKDAGIAAAVTAMEAVLRGEAAISPELTARLVDRLRETPEAGIGLRPVRSSLTTREWEVLDLMSPGASTVAIAARLVLAEDTVYSHVKNIMRKLKVHTRQEAIDAARAQLRTGAVAPADASGLHGQARASGF